MLYPQIYSKTCVKRPLSKRPKIGFHSQLSLNAGGGGGERGGGGKRGDNLNKLVSVH